MALKFKCPRCDGELEQCEVDWILCRTCHWSSFYSPEGEE